MHLLFEAIQPLLTCFGLEGGLHLVELLKLHLSLLNHFDIKCHHLTKVGGKYSKSWDGLELFFTQHIANFINQLREDSHICFLMHRFSIFLIFLKFTRGIIIVVFDVFSQKTT